LKHQIYHAVIVLQNVEWELKIRSILALRWRVSLIRDLHIFATSQLGVAEIKNLNILKTLPNMWMIFDLSLRMPQGSCFLINHVISFQNSV